MDWHIAKKKSPGHYREVAEDEGSEVLQNAAKYLLDQHCRRSVAKEPLV